MLKLQSAFTRGVGQGLDAAVITIAAAIKHQFGYPLGRGAFGKLGKWSTSTPDIIQLVDDTGTFRVLKPGTGSVAWKYADKEFEAKIQAQ